MKYTGIHIIKLRLGKDLGKIVEKTTSPLVSWPVVPWGATNSRKPELPRTSPNVVRSSGERYPGSLMNTIDREDPRRPGDGS